MVTSVRDPASRAISRFYFTAVSRNHSKTDDDTTIAYLQTTIEEVNAYAATLHQGGYQTSFLSLQETLTVAWSAESPTEVIHPPFGVDTVKQNFDKL